MAISKAKTECLKAYDDFQREYVIQERVPDAIYDFPYIRPEPPKLPKQIDNYGKPIDERTFPYYADDFIHKMEAMIDTNLTEYLEFVEQEWDRRMNGYFFYNGNQLEYITGHHYCTLQYWKIQATKTINGRKRKGRFQPDFIDSQRDVFYFIDHARGDEDCAGLCYISFRRGGKTNIALAEGYWDTTENPESVFAIQSKTFDDAKKQFKKLIDSWKKIPHWFKPEDSGRTSQVNKLLFGQKVESGKDVKDRVYKDVLDSIIYPENSKEEALDGEYASFVFQDECGKSPRNLDIGERWNISRECLMDGTDVIGFGIATSTVEDSDKYGVDSFKLLFNSSNPETRLPNGMTESYMYRLFIPAYYGFRGGDKSEKVSFVDKWGYTDIESSKSYHRKFQKALRGDALLSRKRKYPLDINDCWVTNDAKNNFSAQRLVEQFQHNERAMYPSVVRGNFMWRGGIKWTTVDFYPDQNGRWLVAWQPNDQDRNMFEIYTGTQKKPTRSYCFTGIDPFSHDKVVDETQGSNGAAVTILKNYPGEEIKEGVVCIYDYRQPDFDAQIEDMIMQCVFYSSPALIESNIYSALKGFMRNGYSGYVEYNPLETDKRKLQKGLKGYATTSKENVEALISFVASFILDRVGAKENDEYGFCPFNELIQQCIDFNPEKRGPYDLVMALGLAVILTREEKKSPNIGWTFQDFYTKVDMNTANRVIQGLNSHEVTN
jgi:hypothetical protein|tara:strand:- start:4235 stop:6385 length:2151 start_codon:yes stop_codon:yes gene_type:complete